MEYIIEFLKILTAIITIVSIFIISHYVIRYFRKMKPINFFTKEKLWVITKSTLYLSTLSFIYIQAITEDGWYWWFGMLVFILISEHIKGKQNRITDIKNEDK